MDKIVLDTFAPDASCFEPPPTSPLQQDNCRIDVSFHNREEQKVEQPRISFQRDKDRFIFNTTLGGPSDPSKMDSSKIAVLQGLGFDLQSTHIQSTLNFVVFLNGWFRRNYPGFVNQANYKGGDLLPLSARMANFIASGNIEQDDPIQQKALSANLRDLLLSSDEAKVWFRSMFNSLNDEQKNLKNTPVAMRPRVQWVHDQMNFYDDAAKSFNKLNEAGGLGFNPREAFSNSTVDLVDYIATGQKPLKDVQADLDRLASAVYGNAAVPKELKDPFAFFEKKLEGIGKQSFLEKNTEARKRYFQIKALLHQAVEEHRAELLSLEPAKAFQRSIEYRLQTAADQGWLASRVKSEMDDANLSPQWLKDHLPGLSAAVVPGITYVSVGGKDRVKIDIKKIEANTEALVKDHYIQEREYRIGVVSILRYLLGPTLTEASMEGWVKDRVKPVEVDFNEEQSKRFFAFRDEQNKKISKSVNTTNKVLPFVEGGIFSAGLGLGIYGLAKDKGHRNVFTTVGAIGVGAGGGSLACHVLVKSRNQYIVDSICGVVGGAALGLSAGFLLKPVPPGVIGPPGNPDPDGRNPIGGFGP